MDELELDDIIYLTDEDDNDIAFEFIDVIELGDESYVALLPAESDSNNASDVLFLKVEESDEVGGDVYDSVEDENVLSKLMEVFKEKFADEFNFD